jgi:hypothetical protein
MLLVRGSRPDRTSQGGVIDRDASWLVKWHDMTYTLSWAVLMIRGGRMKGRRPDGRAWERSAGTTTSKVVSQWMTWDSGT